MMLHAAPNPPHTRTHTHTHTLRLWQAATRVFFLVFSVERRFLRKHHPHSRYFVLQLVVRIRLCRWFWSGGPARFTCRCASQHLILDLCAHALLHALATVVQIHRFVVVRARRFLSQASVRAGQRVGEMGMQSWLFSALGHVFYLRNELAFYAPLMGGDAC